MSPHQKEKKNSPLQLQAVPKATLHKFAVCKKPKLQITKKIEPQEIRDLLRNANTSTFPISAFKLAECPPP